MPRNLGIVRRGAPPALEVLDSRRIVQKQNLARQIVANYLYFFSRLCSSQDLAPMTSSKFSYVELCTAVHVGHVVSTWLVYHETRRPSVRSQLNSDFIDWLTSGQRTIKVANQNADFGDVITLYFPFPCVGKG